MYCLETVAFRDKPYTSQVHCHFYHQLFFVAQGRIDLTIGEVAYVVEAPAVIFIERLQPHSFISGPIFHRYYVNIDHQQACVQFQNREYLLTPFGSAEADRITPVLPLTQVRELEYYFDLLHRQFQSDGFQDYQLALLECILQQLRTLAPERFVTNLHPLTKAVSQLQRRFKEKPADTISLAELAEEYHFSVSYLTHKFKQVTGYSIGEFRMMCRIDAAKQLLLTTECPVSEIGYRCGFADTSNFCRYFRQKVGCSPSAFRSCVVDYE